MRVSVMAGSPIGVVGTTATAVIELYLVLRAHYFQCHFAICDPFSAFIYHSK